MKKMISVIALTVLGLSPVLVASADDMSGTPASNSAPNAMGTNGSNSNPSYNAPAAQNPTTQDAKPLAANWTKVKGTVKSADPAANQVKIQDDKGNLSLVNVDQNTVIHKDGKKVVIGDLQNGDRIIITRRRTTPSSNPS